MEQLSTSNFGLLIAFAIPGYTTLWGISRHFQELSVGLGQTCSTETTVSGFLHVTLVSVAIGVIVSAVRWLFLDTILHQTGLRRPKWNDAKLASRVDAFQSILESHYRFYQFYGNMFVAVLIGYSFERLFAGFRGYPFGGLELGTLVLLCLLFAASRDTLEKYYRRSERLLK